MTGRAMGPLAAALTAVCVGCHTPSPAPDAPTPPNDGLTAVERERLSGVEDGRQAYEDGLELLAEREVKLAMSAFQRSLQLDPNRYDAHFQLGLCYYQLGQYKLEIAEYHKCLALRPHVPHALKNLGHAEFASDNLAAARAAYDRYLELEPNDGKVLYNQGLIALDLGDYEAARELFKRCSAVGLAQEAEDRLREIERR